MVGVCVRAQGETTSSPAVPAHVGLGWLREFAHHVLFAEVVRDELPAAVVETLRLRVMRHCHAVVALAGRALPQGRRAGEGHQYEHTM